MSDKWQQQKERGSLLLLYFMSWLSLNVGRPVARALLVPICAYFIVCSVAARRASREYLATVFGRPARLRDIFRHYHTFAATILDRVYFLVDRYSDYDISVRGAEVINARIAEKKGFLLLGAHLGSFEVLHAMGAVQKDLRVKAIMYPQNSHRVTALRRKLKSEIAAETISLGSPSAMLEVKEHLESGGAVGMLGDRVMRTDKAVQSCFFGRRALFPEGPMVLANLLNVPVVLMFGLHMGNRRYHVCFELFAETVTIAHDRRDADIKRWVDMYVSRLEHYCQVAPFNWFNFYDFWNEKKPSV